MWSSVMSNIACCYNHIIWTVLHVAVPAGENVKIKLQYKMKTKTK